MKFIGFIICSFVIFSATNSLCQEGNNWDFELAPFYLWAINVDGNTGVRSQSTNVDVEFSDVWDNLEYVYTFRLNTIYRKKYGLMIDYNYLDLGKEQQTGVGNVDASFKSQILNMAGTYRFIDNQHTTLEGVAGFRYMNMEAEVAVGSLGVNLERDKNWTDPIVGVRFGYQISDKWALRIYGDIGGFGVSSDFTWQGVGMVYFQPWKNVAFGAGYRGIGTDYESGSGAEFTYDAVIHGPMIGLDIRF